MDELNHSQSSPQPGARGLRTILGTARRRLRLRDGWLLAQRALWLGFVGSALVQLAGRLWPVERLWLWTAAPVAACLLAVAAYAFLRRMPLLQVARRADAELGLKERLATALLLEEWQKARAQGQEAAAFEPTLVVLQEQDALAAARSIDLRRDLSFPWLKRPLLAAAGLAALALVLAVLPNPMDSILEERRAVAEAAEEQAAAIEDLQREVEEAQELRPEEREELLRRLEELARQLRANPGDREQALADLSRMEEALRQELDPNMDARRAALESLAAQLQALAGQGEGEEVDLSEAAEALERLAEQAAGAQPAEQQDLARSLAQMAARAAASGDQALAQALSAMAQAMQAGDVQAASEAAQAAARAMDEARSQMAAQETMRRALSSVQASRRAMAQAGSGQAIAREPGEGQGQGQGEGQGEGQGQGQGQGQGEGQGQGQGQGQGNQAGGGGGSQADTLPPGQSSGQAGRPQGEGQAGRVGDPASQVYVPWERRPGGGEEVVIPGQEGGQGETETRETENPLPGSAGEALVPYHEVYQTYLDAAQQAMESGYVPPGLRELVRAYFSQLEP
jgi:hypothetical protein